MNPSPRRELQLQGPRPTPLKIHKDSHKIKKPPIPPPQSQSHQQQQQLRQPVIIYTVSPKTIHTNPCDFMSLVQRLTGLSSSSSSSSSSSDSNTTLINQNNNTNVYYPLIENTSMPAARFATIEKATWSPKGEKTSSINYKSTSSGRDHHHMMMMMSGNNNVEEGGGGFGMMDYNNKMMMESSNKSLFPGILSPGPGSLQPVPQNYFTPPSDSFFHDLSPVVHGNRNFMEGSFMPNTPPYSYFVSPHLLNSPNSSIDLFSNFSDL